MPHQRGCREHPSRAWVRSHQRGCRGPHHRGVLRHQRVVVLIIEECLGLTREVVVGLTREVVVGLIIEERLGLTREVIMGLIIEECLGLTREVVMGLIIEEHLCLIREDVVSLLVEECLGLTGEVVMGLRVMEPDADENHHKFIFLEEAGFNLAKRRRTGGGRYTIGILMSKSLFSSPDTQHSVIPDPAHIWAVWNPHVSRIWADTMSGRP
ncbi:hypothetical protein F2P79_014365 [Pimephales promelas]|nr:hypothetical protein F2P79_014365 [Pimephales promelas]